MKAKLQLRKPERWQDFESLCKKLWGEIWQAPEIKKNGRSGQAQHGVDIYGVPKGETGYYGIQCKGKDDYTNSTLTEKEVDKEIENAKSFDPPLKKFYFATTANKDAQIEAYVRNKDLDSRAKGGFEIHLYSWEDIVDLIDENRLTHDWYVNSNNFITSKGAKLTFSNNEETLILRVPFIRKVIKYSLLKKVQERNPSEDARLMVHSLWSTKSPFTNTREVDKSYESFFLRIHNTGNSPIEEYKIHLRFIGEFRQIKGPSSGFWSPAEKKYIRLDVNTYINESEKTGRIIPLDKVLVPSDTLAFDDITIYPHFDTNLEIHWKLVSTDFQESGILSMTIEPDIKDEIIPRFVESESDIKPDEITVEPLIVTEEYHFLY